MENTQVVTDVDDVKMNRKDMSTYIQTEERFFVAEGN